jgi:hypothetical protein
VAWQSRVGRGCTVRERKGRERAREERESEKRERARARASERERARERERERERKPCCIRGITASMLAIIKHCNHARLASMLFAVCTNELRSPCSSAWVCVCVRACVRVRACACARARTCAVRVCMRDKQHGHMLTPRRMAQLFAELPLDELNGEILDAFNQIDSDGSGSLDMSRFLALSPSPCIPLL